jgi:hypothetical protein
MILRNYGWSGYRTYWGTAEVGICHGTARLGAARREDGSLGKPSAEVSLQEVVKGATVSLKLSRLQEAMQKDASYRRHWKSLDSHRLSFKG